MEKKSERLIKFVINGFLAMGMIILLYSMLYAFFYDSRKYIINLYMLIQWLFIRTGLNLTNNFYVNLSIVYLCILIILYILGNYIFDFSKKDNRNDAKNNLKLPKSAKLSKGKGQIRKY